MQKLKNSKTQELKTYGFTFIELLVSVTIMAVMMAVAVVSYSSTNIRSRDAKRKADLETIRSALEICRSNAGEYPAVIYNSVTCSDVNATVTLQVTPKDPKTSDFYSYSPTSTTTYTLSTSLELPSYPTDYSLENP